MPGMLYSPRLAVSRVTSYSYSSCTSNQMLNSPAPVAVLVRVPITVPAGCPRSAKVLLALPATETTCPAVRVPIVAVANVLVPLVKLINSPVTAATGAVTTTIVTFLTADLRTNTGNAVAVKAPPVATAVPVPVKDAVVRPTQGTV